MMAIERSEFFIGYCWPLRPHLTESFHPTVAVLTFETRRLPDQKQSITRKMAFDPSHKGSFLRRAEMVERLADPDHVKWTLPSLNCLDEILTAKFDWTSKRGKGVPCDVQRGLGNVDADVASDAGASERYGREGRSAAAQTGPPRGISGVEIRAIPPAFDQEENYENVDRGRARAGDGRFSACGPIGPV
jgi:hypothetical protein